MRFSILAKIALLFSFVLVTAMASILWNTNRVFYDDKEAFLVESHAKLSQAMSLLMEEKITGLISKMAIFAANYQSLSPAQKKQADLNSVLFNQYEDFLSIAALDVASGQLQWIVSNDLSEAKTWPIDAAQQLIQNLAFQKASDSQLYFQRLSSPDGKAIFSMVVRAQMENPRTGALQAVFLTALVRSEIFTSVVEPYKAALNVGFLVDESGFVYAHPQESLLGQSLLTHGVVKEIQQKAKPAGAGDQYLDEKSESLAAGYEKIRNTNLYAVITTPRKQAFIAANELFRSLLVLGGAVLLIGLSLSYLFTRWITSPLHRLRAVAAEIGAGNFSVPIAVKAKDEVGDLAGSIEQMADSLRERDTQLEASKMALVQSEKMSAFGQLSAGIAHEVKNPLAGILGHTQLAKAKVKNDDLKKHLDIIESETRRTKEIIENLMKFARAEKLELIATNMWDVVQAAVDLVEHQLSLQGVKIRREIERVPAVLANGNQIQQVMLNLMMNAGHAMEDCENKSLQISLRHLPEKNVVQLQIEDSGHGMPEEVKNKIFEPFFTTKPAGKGTGLGLSVSVGIVKDHNAQIYVESTIDVGTSFFIEFPVAEEEELPVSNYVPKFGEDSEEQLAAKALTANTAQSSSAPIVESLEDSMKATELDAETMRLTEDSGGKEDISESLLASSSFSESAGDSLPLSLNDTEALPSTASASAEFTDVSTGAQTAEIASNASGEEIGDDKPTLSLENLVQDERREPAIENDNDDDSDDEGEDFIVNTMPAGEEHGDSRREISAVDAIAGFLDEEEDGDIQAKMPPPPPPDRASKVDESLPQPPTPDWELEEAMPKQASRKPPASEAFAVKIRKPKLKR